MENLPEHRSVVREPCRALAPTCLQEVALRQFLFWLLNVLLSDQHPLANAVDAYQYSLGGGERFLQ